MDITLSTTNPVLRALSVTRLHAQEATEMLAVAYYHPADVGRDSPRGALTHAKERLETCLSVINAELDALTQAETR